MRESETDDDFYETYEADLDDDEISAKEEAFMQGFTKARGNEPDEEIEVEIEDIELQFDMEEAPRKKGSIREEGELEAVA